MQASKPPPADGRPVTAIRMAFFEGHKFRVLVNERGKSSGAFIYMRHKISVCKYVGR